MDKNQILGWVFIALIIGGFVYYESSRDPITKEKDSYSTDTSPEKKSTNESHQATIHENPSNKVALPDSLKNLFEQEQLIQAHGIFHTAAQGKEAYVIVENEKLKLWISKKGAYISRAQLKNHRSYPNYIADNNEALELFIKDSANYALQFQHDGKNLSTKDYYFNSTTDSLFVNEGNNEVIFELSTSTGANLQFKYRLNPEEYLMDFTIQTNGLNKYISGENNKLWLDWEQFSPRQEKSLKQERQIASVFYYSDENGRDYLSETSSSDQVQVKENLKWIAFKQQFFTTTLISTKNELAQAEMSVKFNEQDTTYVKQFKTRVGLDLLQNDIAISQLNFYIGPNDFKRLSSYENLHLQEQLNLGWGIFRWVNEYFIYPIFRFLLNTGIGVGIAIILLTFAIKLILFPITYKNYLSSAKMRVIKPHLEKINEENKNADPIKKQQAVMALYKQTGVNPLAGCIPALLQMPILIALYRLFPAAIELRHARFLWAEDLSSFDSILDLPFTIWFYGNHVSLFTLLMAISMFFYMRFNQQMTPSTGASGGGEMQEAIQKNMKVMMNFMPFFMLFFFNGFAAGLSFYYFLANTITIGQTLVIKHYIINENKILNKINEHMTKPMQKSKWQKKLEEMQSKQKK